MTQGWKQSGCEQQYQSCCWMGGASGSGRLYCVYRTSIQMGGLELNRISTLESWGFKGHTHSAVHRQLFVPVAPLALAAAIDQDVPEHELAYLVQLSKCK